MTTQPYWLIREPGREHGFAWVDLDSAITPAKALDEWRKQADPSMLRLLGDLPIEAVLVTDNPLLP